MNSVLQKKRDNYEAQLGSAKDKLSTSKRIKIRNKSWLEKLEREYREFLETNNIEADAYKFYF